MNSVGPVSWEEPELGERVAVVPIENGYLDVGVDETGIRRFRIFVAQSGDHFDADEFDISLLKRIGQTGLRWATC